MNSAQIIKSNKISYRRHVFPPYRGGAPLGAVDEISPNFEQEFQQGLEEGHKEGVERGLQQGLVDGRQEGYNTGLMQGITEGQITGAQLFKDAITQLSTVQKKVDELAKHKLVVQQELIADLVGQVSRQVIRAELTLNPKQVLNLVEEAIQVFADDIEKVRIFLNVDDKKRLKDLGILDLNGWALEVDDKLAVGDSYIKSSDKEIAVATEERFQQCMESMNQSMTEAS
ncbi:MAG: flagellar assembly protein FliH [Moritella sp.]|uniref:FliH/SctL family protein n=1 Tax=Moritella sp. TaxID=78556 RepID=UPI001E0151EE|nr:FliH/SctL family protein [Moritella sp.]NQZ50873.1 flagellar assembly protein FliH [Moritella sp.]